MYKLYKYLRLKTVLLFYGFEAMLTLSTVEMTLFNVVDRNFNFI